MSKAEWQGTVVKKYGALLDGSNLYPRILVRLDNGQTVRTRRLARWPGRVDRTFWKELTIGDAVRKTPDGGIQRA
jgi:hypothetical protein